MTEIYEADKMNAVKDSYEGMEEKKREKRKNEVDKVEDE